MKTITLEEFRELINAPGWKHEQVWEKVGIIGGWTPIKEESKRIQHFGYISKISTRGDVKITYTIGWDFIRGDEDSFDTDGGYGEGRFEMMRYNEQMKDEPSISQWYLEGVEVASDEPDAEDEDDRIMVGCNLFDNFSDEELKEFTDLDFSVIERE